MRDILIITAIGVFTLVRSATVPEERYPSRYDYLDVDMILNSKRLVRNYADCILGKKPCPPQGKELRRILPEALETVCEKCTDKQKETALLLIHRIQKDYPSIWDEIQEKWDPTGTHVRRFEDSFSTNKVQGSPDNTIISTRFGKPQDSNQPPESNEIFGQGTRIVPSIAPNTPLPFNDVSTSDKPITKTTKTVLTTKNVATESVSVKSTRDATTTMKTVNRIPIFTTSFSINAGANTRWLDQVGTQMVQTAGKIANNFIKSFRTVINGK